MTGMAYHAHFLQRTPRRRVEGGIGDKRARRGRSAALFGRAAELTHLRSDGNDRFLKLIRELDGYAIHRKRGHFSVLLVGLVQRPPLELCCCIDRTNEPCGVR